VKQHEGGRSSEAHDAAVAGAAVVMEEFFGHCPNGMAAAVHERLSQIIEAAIEAAEAARTRSLTEPSKN
jgi:hypothetical protein